MESAPKQADRINIIAVIVIGTVGALVVYASFVALQAFYNAEASKLEMKRNAEGKSAALREFQMRQHGELTGYRMLEKRKQIVSLPIEQAMKLVIADVRSGNAGNLVPAVGPHDSPTAPVVNMQQATEASTPVEPATPNEGTEGATPAEGAAPAPAGGAAPAGAAAGNPPAAGAAPATNPGGAPAGAQ